MAPPQPTSDAAAERHQRILAAAFALFMERGYAGAGTRDIAARAQVSKREIYALFGSKLGLLEALVSERSRRMRSPAAGHGGGDLARTLREFGAAFLRELTRPTTTALYRLAVVEAERSPAIARTLDECGRAPVRRAAVALIAAAQQAGRLGPGRPDDLADQFFALLMGDLPLRLLLGQAQPPAEDEIERRAAAAGHALLGLHPAG